MFLGPIYSQKYYTIRVDSPSRSVFQNFLTLAAGHRGIIFNLLFVLYYLTLQPVLLRRLADVDQSNQTDYLIGALIFAAMILELIGFWLKKPLIARRFMASPQSDAAPASRILLALVPLAHIFLTAVMAIKALPTVGLPFHGNNILALVVFLLALSREGLWLGWLVQFFQNKASPDPPRRWPGISEETQSHLSDMIGDVCLFFFGCIAYSTAWEVLASTTPIQPDESLILQYFGAVILFLMIYPPSRGVYSIEELFTYRPPSVRHAGQISFLAVLIAALFAIPRV
jgi:hypothetical protein